MANLAIYQKSKSFFDKLGFYIFVFWTLSFSLNGYPIESNQTKSTKLQYAIFYMETEGEFVVPIDADAPTIYSWSEPGIVVKGDISKIWVFLGITSTVDYSFTNIENSLLNHSASKGWELKDLEITSVPVPSNSNFRTAYRYIFQREK